MWKAIKLRFTSPLHLSRGFDEYDKSETIYHSDSLKAAIYAIGIQYHENWINWDTFSQSCCISSCFPYAGNEFFLPKPVLKKKIIVNGIANDLQPKKAKKLEFIEKSQFEEFINTPGDTWQVDKSKLHPNGKFICRQSETFTTTLENGKTISFDFYKTEVQQRVRVPLEGETDSKGKPMQSQPYYVDRIYFNQNCGLYFIAEFSTPEFEKQFMQALKILGEHGIGTDRSVGNGFFNFDQASDVQDFSLQIKSNYNLQMPLGLYIPTKEEHAAIDFDKSHWGIIKRGGFMAGSQHIYLRHLWKNDIYMFSEGSIFMSSSELKGKDVDLQPEWNSNDIHPVWRDGKCLMLKF